MLNRLPWLRLGDGIQFEEQEALEEGRSLPTELRDALRTAAAMPMGAERDALARELFARVQELPYAGGSNVEPDDITGIRALCASESPVAAPQGDALFDAIYGGWLARCAGCLLGKPVEGWRTAELKGYLEGMNNWPPQRYIRSDAPESVKAGLDFPDWMNPFDRIRAFIDQVDCMPEDDDTNYTVIALRLLETCGREFTPADVAECWLMNLPLLHLCTAERAAYRNLAMSIEPPESARYCNGYRQWIGAQIRADLFGYVNPGDMRTAADMAYRDASISHVKNGIYGEMWAAAMIAAAFVEKDVEKLPLLALKEVPANCWLARAVNKTAGWKAEGIDWQEALARIHEEWDEYNQHHWCHTVSNAQIVTVALLWGGRDLTRTLGIAVAAGFDTDCNAATAGSVLGVVLGAKELPAQWTEPLHDRLISGVDGMGSVSIRELAERTLALCAQ